MSKQRSTHGQVIRYRDDVCRYFLDTEFIEDGHTIELLSIGIVCEDGREYYAANSDADHSRANDWVKANVLPHLPPPGNAAWKPRTAIRDEVTAFLLAGAEPEVWAYFGDYDWVALCQLFGRMIDLPKGMSMLCMDLEQLSVMLGSPEHPQMIGTEHNALDDARWGRALYTFLRALPVSRAEAAERELAALRALVRRYVEAHAARVAHSAREPHDEYWYAEREALNNAVSDALAELRAEG